MTKHTRGPNPDQDPGHDPATPATDAADTAHASHERPLIAARAAGDLTGPELARADALRERCPACRRLHDDLLAIAIATRHLPAPARPPELDYRISAERASQLARGAVWRRLLRPFGRSGSATVRPLAAAFTTLGLAGLLLAALPSLQLGGAAGFLAMSAPTAAPRDALDRTSAPEVVAPGGAPTPAATGGDTAGGEPTIDTTTDYGPAVTADDKGAAPSAEANSQATTAPSREGDDGAEGGSTGDESGAIGGSGGQSPLVILSLGLLGAGLALFLLRRVALRLR
ncbi:MAG: hypothetical protein L0227_04790 [Chloroflexi bacterium]|nr:hypothetical protein [Chloroflexota bacterium]